MLETELGAYARSEIIQSLLAGVVLGAGFYLLGLNYPALLAVVAALSWLLPWLGAIIALTTLVVAELPALILHGPGSLLSVVAAAFFTVLVFVILEFVVEPRMFNRRRYNSLFIVLAVIALAETFGILGLLLGPMVAVAIQATLEHVERERVAVRRPATDLAALDARIAELRANAASGEDIPREWISIVDRLEALIARARARSPLNPALRNRLDPGPSWRIPLRDGRLPTSADACWPREPSGLLPAIDNADQRRRFHHSVDSVGWRSLCLDVIMLSRNPSDFSLSELACDVLRFFESDQTQPR